MSSRYRSGGAGSSNTAASYENSRTVETVSGAVGTLTRLSVAVLVNDRLVPGADLGRIEPKRPTNARLAVDADRRAIIDLVLDAVLTYA